MASVLGLLAITTILKLPTFIYLRLLVQELYGYL
jgi:hypothetical protein